VIKGLAGGGDVVGELDIGLRGDSGKQVEALEDETNLGATQAGALRVGEAGEVLALNDERAGCGGGEAAEDVEEGGFAGAGGADDGDELAGVDGEVDVAQGFDLEFAGAVGFAEMLSGDDGLHRRFKSIAEGVMSGEAGGEAAGGGGGFFEEAEFEADGDDAAALGVMGVVAAEGAEAGHADVAVAGEFDASGNEAAVELEDGANLDLKTELGMAGREGFLVKDPAAARGHGVEQVGQDDPMLVVAVAAEVDLGEVAVGCWRV
jgi:hypothetical protein